MIKYILVCLVALLTPVASLAQAAPDATAQSAQPMTHDPAVVAVAQKVVDQTFPPGLFKKMMGPAMQQMMSGMSNQFANMPLQEIAKLGGASPAEVAKLDKVTLAQIMEIVDPVYQKRMDIVMNTTLGEMGNVMSKIEPDMREGYVEYYANHYSLVQLGEINAFFATPTGSAYASQSMLIGTDPVVVGRMKTMMPKIMQMMPDIIAKATKAQEEAHLPKQRSYKDLTPTQRRQLDRLLSGKKA